METNHDETDEEKLERLYIEKLAHISKFLDCDTVMAVKVSILLNSFEAVYRNSVIVAEKALADHKAMCVCGMSKH